MAGTFIIHWNNFPLLMTLSCSLVTCRLYVLFFCLLCSSLLHQMAFCCLQMHTHIFQYNSVVKYMLKASFNMLQSAILLCQHQDQDKMTFSPLDHIQIALYQTHQHWCFVQFGKCGSFSVGRMAGFCTWEFSRLLHTSKCLAGCNKKNTFISKIYVICLSVDLSKQNFRLWWTALFPQRSMMLALGIVAIHYSYFIILYF